MTDFPRLQALLPEIEEAQAFFELRTRHVYDEEKYRVAAAAFNRVLERAAHALIEDLGADASGDHRDEWRPKSDEDTWFGQNPTAFLRHVLRDGVIPRPGLPDETALH